jgi:hypothetical protein
MAKKNKAVESEFDQTEVEVTETGQSSTEIAIAEAFNSARESGQTEDQIKLSMINAGASFKNVSKFYSDLMVSAGLAMSKDDRQKVLDEVLTGNDLSTEDQFNGVVGTLLSRITGSTDQSIKTMVRAWAKKNTVDVFTPAKPESTGGNRNPFVSNFHAALVENPKLTEDELKGIISALTAENQVNPQRWFAQHNNIRKLVNKVAEKYGA